MSVVPANSIPVAFSTSSKLVRRRKATISLSIHSDSNCHQHLFTLGQMSCLFFCFPFLLEEERSGCLGLKNSTKKRLGKKILLRDTQTRPGLFSPFRLSTTSDCLHFLRQGCKIKLDSFTVRVRQWETFPRHFRGSSGGAMATPNTSAVTSVRGPVVQTQKSYGGFSESQITKENARGQWWNLKRSTPTIASWSWVIG